VDDTPILEDFLWACATAKVSPRGPLRTAPGRIRNRAARLLRQALLMR
jgi:putative glutamine amidotransferase